MSKNIYISSKFFSSASILHEEEISEDKQTLVVRKYETKFVPRHIPTQFEPEYIAIKKIITKITSKYVDWGWLKFWKEVSCKYYN